MQASIKAPSDTLEILKDKNLPIEVVELLNLKFRMFSGSREKQGGPRCIKLIKYHFEM